MAAVMVILYVFIVLSLIMIEQYYSILTKSGLSTGPYVAILLFCIYVVMLFFEVRVRKRKNTPYDVTLRKSFIFSFSIGVIWGVMMSFAAGFHYRFSPLDVVLMLVGYIAIGFLFGFLGRKISDIVWTL